MSLSGKIRFPKPSRSGSYYSSYQRSRREETTFSRTHFNFILFCFAFATNDNMQEDLFWQWVERAHAFSPEQKEVILSFRTRDNENMHSVGFLCLARNVRLYDTIAEAMRRYGNAIGQFLNHSLEWARTSQGHDFWMDLNRRFDHCWTCIRRATINSAPNIGIQEFKSAIMANISAHLLGRHELMNNFFFNYDEELIRYEERMRENERPEIREEHEVQVHVNVDTMASGSQDQDREPIETASWFFPTGEFEDIREVMNAISRSRAAPMHFTMGPGTTVSVSSNANSVGRVYFSDPFSSTDPTDNH